MPDLSELTGRIADFNSKRDWDRYHNPKDLALSVCIEAAELLELFQWRSAEEGGAQSDALADEIADVLIYTLTLASKCGIDPGEAVMSKLTRNESRFPPEEHSA